MNLASHAATNFAFSVFFFRCSGERRRGISSTSFPLLSFTKALTFPCAHVLRSHQISIQGCLCREYYKVRSILYGLYEII